MPDTNVNVNLKAKDLASSEIRKAGKAFEDVGKSAQGAQATTAVASQGMSFSIKGVGTAMKAAIAATGIGAVIQTVVQLSNWVRMLGRVFYENLEPVRRLVDGIKTGITNLAKSVASLFGMKWENKKDIEDAAKAAEDAAKAADEATARIKENYDKLVDAATSYGLTEREQAKKTRDERIRLNKETADKIEKDETLKLGKTLENYEVAEAAVKKMQDVRELQRKADAAAEEEYQAKLQGLAKATTDKKTERLKKETEQTQKEINERKTLRIKEAEEQLKLEEQLHNARTEFTLADLKQKKLGLTAELVAIREAAKQKEDAASSESEKDEIRAKLKIDLREATDKTIDDLDKQYRDRVREALDTSIRWTIEEKQEKIKSYKELMLKRKEAVQVDYDLQAEQGEITLELAEKLKNDLVELYIEDYQSYIRYAQAKTQVLSKMAQEMKTIMGNAIDAISAGFGDLAVSFFQHFSHILSGQRKFFTEWKAMWSDIGYYVINMITQMIVRLLLFKAIALATGIFAPAAAFPITAGEAVVTGMAQTKRGETRRINGPVGMPVPIIAHGGEIIGRPERGGFGGLNITVNGALDPIRVAEQIRKLLYNHNRLTGLSVA